MKHNLIAYLTLLAALLTFGSCSDDNDTPQQSQVEKHPSLVDNFLETYGFRTFDSESSPNWDKAHRVKVHLEGVESYQKISDIGNNTQGPLVTVKAGKSYTFQNNPLGFNRLLEKYGDTNYQGPVLDDTAAYRPHPVAITGIHFSLATKFQHTNVSTLTYGGYNENYPVGSDCTSLFRIRYRTYYDYIRNGYSWQGLDTDSPWKEMDLEEFNRRGGDKLIDMTRFYLFPKEAPAFRQLYYYFVMTVSFANGRTNVRNRYLDCSMGIDKLDWGAGW